MAVHQHTALAGLVAIAVHGLTLLGDAHLSPSLGDIAIPFTSEHEPLWTGLGVTGGWLAAGARADVLRARQASAPRAGDHCTG